MPLGAIVSGGIGLLRDQRSRSRLGRQISTGHRLDNRYSLEKEEALYARAMERGLTPQEYYGSSAPGAPGVSGGAQVLGNQSNQARMQATQLAADAAGKAADRAVQKDIAKIHADASVKSAVLGSTATQEAATTAATASVAVARLNNLLREREITLKEQEYNEVIVPAAAEKLLRSKQETKRMINEVATTTPKWKRWEVLTKLGFDNTIQNMIINRHGIDPTNPESMSNISKEKFEKILGLMLGASSRSYREFSGIGKTVKSFYEWLYNLPKSEVDFTGPTLGSGPP